MFFNKKAVFSSNFPLFWLFPALFYSMRDLFQEMKEEMRDASGKPFLLHARLLGSPAKTEKLFMCKSLHIIGR